jgi:hypothetical protein
MTIGHPRFGRAQAADSWASTASGAGFIRRKTLDACHEKVL